MAGLEKIITDELVFEVADRLTAEGGRVSNRAIWSEVGGGSMTTIAASLRRWRERQELRAEQPIERAPLPDHVADVMHDTVNRLWKAAQDTAQQEIDRLTQVMNERITQATAERDDTLTELQSTVEELQTAHTKCDGIGAERDAAIGELADLHQQITAATERVNTADVRAVENERRANDLRDELTRVHEQAKSERDRHADTLATAKTELDKARAELVAHKQTTATEIEHLRAELATVKANTEIERNSERKETSTAREETAKLRGQVEAMQTYRAELMRLLEDRQAPQPDESASTKTAKTPKKVGG